MIPARAALSLLLLLATAGGCATAQFPHVEPMAIPRLDPSPTPPEPTLGDVSVLVASEPGVKRALDSGFVGPMEPSVAFLPVTGGMRSTAPPFRRPSSSRSWRAASRT